MSSFDLTPFMTLRRHMTIVHHVPGRVRLRIGASLFKELKQVDTGMFKSVMGAIDGIKDVRLNPAAASVVITYTPSIIRNEWWETLLNGEDHEALQLLQQLLSGQFANVVAMAQEKN
ncbi:MAG: hypothetical protein PVG66_07080 [Chromatiales bacterium]|jgi:hypothetical protein